MHERSLVTALLKQVAQIQSEHGAAAVREIVVEVGPLSGVEPELLNSAYADLVKSDAQLVIKRVPLTVYCLWCRFTSSLDRFQSVCPCCQSMDLQMTGGDAFRLLHVTLDVIPRGCNK